MKLASSLVFLLALLGAPSLTRAQALELGSPQLEEPLPEPPAPTVVAPEVPSAPASDPLRVDRTPKHVSNVLWPIGVGMLFNTYVPMIIVAAMLWDSGVSAEWGVIPVAGPLIILAERPDIQDQALFGSLAAAQAVGLGVLIAGVAMRASWSEPFSNDVLVVPMGSTDGAGLMLAGAF